MLLITLLLSGLAMSIVPIMGLEMFRDDDSSDNDDLCEDMSDAGDLTDEPDDELPDEEEPPVEDDTPEDDPDEEEITGEIVIDDEGTVHLQAGLSGANEYTSDDDTPQNVIVTGAGPYQVDVEAGDDFVDLSAVEQLGPNVYISVEGWYPATHFLEDDRDSEYYDEYRLHPTDLGGWVGTGEGNDTVILGGGFVDLDTGSGDDTVYMGSGTSIVYTGSGDDVVYGSSDEGLVNFYIDTGWGNDTIYAPDYVSDTGDGRIDADFGDDTIYGGDADDRMIGNVGSDTIYGGDGDDWIRSNGHDPITSPRVDSSEYWGGEDVLDGQAGDDRLFGDKYDVLTGGEGTDSFYISQGDVDGVSHAVITDFDPDSETLEIKIFPEFYTGDVVYDDPLDGVELVEEGGSTFVVYQDQVLAELQGATGVPSDSVEVYHHIIYYEYF